MRNLSIKALAWAQARTRREEGQTIVEYGLVIGVISVVVIAALYTAIDGGIVAVAAKITAKLA